MPESSPCYGLVFYPRADAPAEERDKGRLITLHLTAADALDFYERQRENLLETYQDPAQWNDMPRLCLYRITDKTIGAAWNSDHLHQMIQTAVNHHKECLMVHFDPKTNYALDTNEINKLTINGDIEFFLLDQPTEPAEKKSVGKPKNPTVT